MDSNITERRNAFSQAVAALSDESSLGLFSPWQWHGEPLPDHAAISRILDLARAILFPGFFGDTNVTRANVEYYIGVWADRLRSLLVDQFHAGLCMASESDGGSPCSPTRHNAEIKADELIARLPELRRVLDSDVEATYHGDPAATSRREVLYCYPGIRAISNYRLAHEMVKLEVPIIPRMISELAHSETGVDIHPAATIGESFTIDHGTGIVIGATAVVGHHVKIYQGVTLGARSFDLDERGNPVKGVPRHPIIGNHVVIYSNATILGRITIGDNAVIGGNLWVTQDVAPGERLIQAKADNILRLKQQ